MDKVEILPQDLKKDISEDGTILIQIRASYPEMQKPQKPNLNHCLKKAAENMVELVSQGMIGEARAAAVMLPEALPFQIDKSFTSTYLEHGILSFFSDLYLYAGGLHGVSYRCGNSLHLRDGSPLFITALFPKSTDIRKTVADFIAKSRQEEQNPDESQAQILRKNAEQFFSPENIYLTDRGLAVFYQPHTLGPFAAGIPVFVIPYSEEGGPYPPVRLGLPERP